MNPVPQDRQHLFSSGTGLCVRCGKSAEDDAIENTPCGSDEPPPCEACGGMGWLLTNVGNDQSPRHEIQRCDDCQKFSSDEDALTAVARAASVLPELIAAVKHLQENWEKNLTEPMARLNQALLKAETTEPKGKT